MVYGSKDNVVRVNEKMLNEMKCNFPMVKVVRMEGLGHDPFEEDKDAFLAELERVLQTNTNSG
jgi:pimeloyl-ACP methyl ester carboxylesterase